MDTITHGSQVTTNAPVVTDDVPMVAFTCPSCDGHNVTDSGLGQCGDCGLTDNLSAFTGGGMTAKAKFSPSRYAQAGGRARSFDAPRAFTISGNVD